MDNSRWERIGAASGIASVVIALAAFFSAPQPPKLNELTKTMTYFGDHRTGVLVQSYLFLASTALLVWFAGSVRTHLRRNEDGSGRLSDIAFGGALVAAGMVTMSSLMLATAAFRADVASSATATRLMTDLGSIGFAMAFMPLAVFVGACAIASYRSGAFPLMHSAISAALAVGFGLTPMLMFGHTGFFSLNNAVGGLALAMFGFFAWEAATSAMLIVGEAAAAGAGIETEGVIVVHEHWHLRRASGQ